MQSPLTKDFFSLFGLPVAFHLADEELTARYREMQSAVHPDRYANAALQEQRMSIQVAAHINEAYQTLKNPLSRIRYILELKGVDLQDREAAPDPDFLMRQIEWRETMEEIQAAGGPGSRLADLVKEITAYIAELQEKIAGELEDETLLSAALRHYNELQYFYRLLEEARDIGDMVD